MSFEEVLNCKNAASLHVTEQSFKFIYIYLNILVCFSSLDGSGSTYLRYILRMKLKTTFSRVKSDIVRLLNSILSTHCKVFILEC